MNIERLSLSEQAEKTQKTRNNYLPLEVLNKWGELVEEATETRTKWMNGLGVTIGIVALSAVADGNVAIETAYMLSFLGGAAVGEKIPAFSWLLELMKDKKAIGKVWGEKKVSKEEIADLLVEFPDVVAREEVELWPKEVMGVSSHKHPERFEIMNAILHDNPESPDAVVDVFMDAQQLAQEKRESKDCMREQAYKKAMNIILGILVMAGITYAADVLFGHKGAGIGGLSDEALWIILMGGVVAKDKIKSLFSKFNVSQ
jgi:hypothetical protein